MKFKVGDEIRGIKGSRYTVSNEKMTRGRVEQTNSDGDIRVRILEHANKAKVGQSFHVDSQYFEHIAPRESIHITRDGNAVHAVHKRNGEIIKRTKAVCDPRDEFDFSIGASFAFARALGIKTFTDGATVPDIPAPEPIKFNFEDFKAGRFAVHCPTEHEADVFLAYLHGRGVEWQSRIPAIACSKWGLHREKTAYRCYGTLLNYCNVTFFLEHGCPVIPFCKADL